MSSLRAIHLCCPMPPPAPSSFKGIALFTPAGDLIYCIDPEKRKHWHSQLCAVLQDVLGLAEPPHFLVPCYSATIDRWLDPRTHQVQTAAEASPLVMRHQALLNVLFGVEAVWQVSDRPEEICDPLVLESYRHQFPELWEEHDLVMQFQRARVQPGVSGSLVESQLGAPAGSLSWLPLENHCESPRLCAAAICGGQQCLDRADFVPPAPVARAIAAPALYA